MEQFRPGSSFPKLLQSWSAKDCDRLDEEILYGERVQDFGWPIGPLQDGIY